MAQHRLFFIIFFYTIFIPNIFGARFNFGFGSPLRSGFYPRRSLISTSTTPVPTMNEDPAVTRFRQYLRLNSSHPDPNYDTCVEWIRNQANEIGLEYQKVDLPDPGLFTIVLTWRGLEPNLKSIMFNSHIDVVPAEVAKWKHHPFEAVKESNGNIYARGAQDRKSLGAQYLEAMRRLKAKRFQPNRTIHITFVPDEEVGGAKGMAIFVNSPEFKAMNIGMEMDEGGATPGDEYAVYYGERTPWQMKFIATGRSSHGALMLRDNAGTKLNKVLDQLFEFRNEQLNKLEANSSLDSGDVTSIKLSQLGGGIKSNIVPSEMWAVFDMRIRLGQNWTFNDIEKFLNDTCEEAGPGVRYEFLMKSMIHAEVPLMDENIWWKSFKDIFDERGLKLTPKFFPGATDARFLRNANFTALGFSPLPKTEPLQHQDNEFLNEQTFLDGIAMYEIIMPRLSSIPPTEEDST